MKADFHLRTTEIPLRELTKEHTCPNCGTNKSMNVFYEVENIPVHSVKLVHSQMEALGFPKGNMKLGFCSFCGFISNIAFDYMKINYSSDCEETQGFSSTFNIFHRNLAQKLIGKYDLFNKDIIEIGCGKGEFLTMLCELGNNRGIGFDPAYVSQRNNSQAKDRIKFIEEFYSEKYSSLKADFICCKMTLEHIPNTLEFISMLRRSVGDNLKTVVFFQIPDITRILKDFAFWDIYYEHCSYFCPVSLEKLFMQAGFEVLDLYNVYDDQYLIIEAKASKETSFVSSPLQPVDELNEIYRLVSIFSENINKRFNSWREDIKLNYSAGKKIVIWGGGSKAVSFLTTLGITEEIEYVVDINPHKNGTFIVGTGQKVVLPDFLKDYRPDIVLIMNPVYLDEIRAILLELDLEPKLLPIETND